jgi:NADPH-dependent 2,4-dienoyl-CoA reductase/sulfur reductase-like enzyme
MTVENVDVLIIGGGPAGMAAALGACENGVDNILVVDSSDSLGGILNQCVHNGFGLKIFGEELTGPEFSQRLADILIRKKIKINMQTEAISIDTDRNVTLISPLRGKFIVHARTIFICTGCYERTRESIQIPGARCSGVYTAGVVQELINIYGHVPGENAVILGSGDIGLIMARRLTLEGVNVLGVYEINGSPSGLNRNLVQCLFDFNIPLYLSKTVTRIHGKEQIRAVTIIDVDAKGSGIAGTETEVRCDLLLLSLGLIPDLSILEGLQLLIDEQTGMPLIDEFMRTSFEGIYLCGNAAYVHDLVDNVHEEAYQAGMNSINYINHRVWIPKAATCLTPGPGVANVYPNLVSTIDQKVPVYFRVDAQARYATVEVLDDQHNIVGKKKYRHLAKNQYYRFDFDSTQIKTNSTENLFIQVKRND